MLKIAYVLIAICCLWAAKKTNEIYSQTQLLIDTIQGGKVKELLKDQQNTYSQSKRRYLETNVSFEPCPGPHSEVYDIDDDYSHVEPERITKNNDINLILEGVMNMDVHVDQLKVDVYWNGNLFHSEDHKLDESIEEQEPYELRFKWFVPGFAPSGKYNSFFS